MKKILSAFVILLWGLACFQIIQGKAVAEENKIIEVFHTVGAKEQTSTVEYYGSYEKKYLSLEEKDALLKKAANELGITDGFQITHKYDGSRQEVILTKEAKHAETILRFISTEENQKTKQYVMAKISMDTTMDSAMAMKSRLTDILDEYTKESRSSANVNGCYDGKLTLDERNEKAAEILGQLGARVITEHKDMELYTIYAYSTYLSDYVLQEDNAVNVNVAMRYNSLEDKTYVYVAVPILGVDF